MSIPLDEFYRGTARAESGGNPNAANPYSSARGLYQFTSDTWAGVVRNYGDRYGLRADGVMDADQQERAIRAITENEYLPAVQRTGRQATPAELYAPHLLGVPTYLRLAQADPSAPAASVIPNWVNERGRGVFQANRGVFGSEDITAGEAMARIQAYYNRAAGRGSPAGPRKAPEARPAHPPVASTPAPSVPASSTSLIKRIWGAISRIFKKNKD